MILIDADKVMGYLDNCCCYTGNQDYDNGYSIGIYDAWVKLLDSPTIDPLDVLGICRCKDCIHLGYNNENEPYCTHRYGLSNPKETDYCPYAKRKENSNEID